MTERQKWTKEQTIIALYLYCIIPFNKVNKNNKTIQFYANIIGRSPAALNMKIGNMGRLDPTLKAKNISGLSNGSKMDIEVWQEFSNNWARLETAFNEIIANFNLPKVNDLESVHSSFPMGQTKTTVVKVRINQSFFRASVLAAYNYRCCITGLAQPELLIASHIKPWKDDEFNRLNPQNGLCLNALHDKAFDRGLLSLDDDFRIILSPKLKQTEGFESFFKIYENQSICIPERFSPDLNFLKFHRENIFQI